MKAQQMSQIFEKVAASLGTSLMASPELTPKTGVLDNRGDLDSLQLADLLGEGEVRAGWAMYQSGLKDSIERIPEIQDEALGYLIAGEWCDTQGRSVSVRLVAGGCYHYASWVPGEGQEWLCDERRFRTVHGQAVKYLRLWSDQTDPHGAWRPSAAVFVGFENSGEQG